MKILLLSLIGFSITTFNAGAGQLPDDLVQKLGATIRELCPDAQIEAGNTVFTAKRDTMMFTLHSMDKSGKFYSDTYQKEGPNSKGFILTVSLEEGPYLGALMSSQTLHGPYFPTFFSAPATEDGHNHYSVHFSYGSGLDEKVRNAIFKAISGTRFQPGGAANGSQPVRSETNSTPEAAGSRR